MSDRDPRGCDRRGFMRLAGIGAAVIGAGALAGCSTRTFTPEDFAGKSDVDSTHVHEAMVAAIAADGVVKLAERRYAGNLTIPDGAVLQGSGEGQSIISGAIEIGSRARISGLAVQSTGTHSTFTDGASGSVIEDVTFKGGSTWANLYLNDRAAKNHVFMRCTFSSNVRGGNGVRIVDKGTKEKHYENIRFEACHFHGNHRMNFECIQRADPKKPVVSGYRKIDLIGCVFETSGSINVSYDAGLLDGSKSKRTSGYSTVRRCKISGGHFGLELAGAIRMNVQGNVIRDTADSLISTSQLGPNPANSRFLNNTLLSHVTGANVVFSGTGNSITGNTIETPGQVRFADCGDTLVKDNTIKCIDNGPTAISIEKSFELEFVGNTIVGGLNQSVLQLDKLSVDNSFVGNKFSQPKITFDLRDGTKITRKSNTVKRGTGKPLPSPSPSGSGPGKPSHSIKPPPSPSR